MCHEVRFDEPRRRVVSPIKGPHRDAAPDRRRRRRVTALPSRSRFPGLAQCPVDLPTGAHVDEGTAVLPNYGAANMDPAAYDDPTDVRFDRADYE